MERKNAFVVVKGAAGLGDRILCALTGILYARLTERRLVIDWRDDVYSNDGSNAFPRFFQCQGCEATDEIPMTDSVRPISWRGHLHDSARAVRTRHLPGAHWDPKSWGRVSVDLRRVDYPEDVLVMWFFTEEVDVLRRHFTGNLAHLRRRATKTILRTLLSEHLSLHPSIRERVDQFESEWFTRKVVGVHVRYTDRRGRLQAIRRKLDALLTRSPDVQIFLATDNVDVQRAFTDRYPDVVTSRKWYPASGLPIHRNQERRDRTERGIEALIDMHLLAKCDYLILDESSAFSYVVSLITNQPRAHIFQVERGWWLPPRLRRFVWLYSIRLRRLVSK